MLIPPRFAPPALAALLALTTIATTGCGKKIATVCAEKCGSAANVQICTDSSEKAEATAEERGCESEFEDYAACADAHATCTAGVLDAAQACAAEASAVTACTK